LVGVVFIFFFITGVFNSGEEGWERSCGVRMERIARIHGGAGSECSLVRGRGEKGEGKERRKEGRGKKASDLVKLFARKKKKKKKRVAII